MTDSSPMNDRQVEALAAENAALAADLENVQTELDPAELRIKELEAIARTPSAPDVAMREACIRAIHSLYADDDSMLGAKAGETVELPSYGTLPWDEIGRDVMEAMTGTRHEYEFDPKFYPGHQSPGINFNSLSRIIEKYRLAAPTPAIDREAVALTGPRYGAEFSYPRSTHTENGIPTRSHLQHFSQAELAIYDATFVVESAGGSLAITDAVNLLKKARDRVADHMEGNGDSARASSQGATQAWRIVRSNSHFSVYDVLCGTEQIVKYISEREALRIIESHNNAILSLLAPTAPAQEGEADPLHDCRNPNVLREKRGW